MALLLVFEFIRHPRTMIRRPENNNIEIAHRRSRIRLPGIERDSIFRLVACRSCGVGKNVSLYAILFNARARKDRAMGITETLWEAEDQESRLVEMMSGEAELKEAPLRRDVRSLGRLLGETLKEQAGDQLFDRVEHL